MSAKIIPFPATQKPASSDELELHIAGLLKRTPVCAGPSVKRRLEEIGRLRMAVEALAVNQLSFIQLKSNFDELDLVSIAANLESALIWLQKFAGDWNTREEQVADRSS